MKIFQNIILVGTSHVAEESVKQVNATFKNKPDIIAVELDVGRLYALKHNVKRPKNLDLLKRLGLGGFLFYIFGEYVQKKIGKIVKIEPGKEMMTAVNLAENGQLPLVLIDRDIEITLKRFSKHFKKGEILRMISDSVFNKKKLTFNIEKIPSDEQIMELLDYAKTRYPSLFQILIDERDKYMANKLFRLSKINKDKKIMAVVGAGHIKGIINYLTKLDQANISS